MSWAAAGTSDRDQNGPEARASGPPTGLTRKRVAGSSSLEASPGLGRGPQRAGKLRNAVSVVHP